MWIYIAVFLLLLFVIFKERQALGCPDVPDGRDCDNAEGKAVKGTHPTPADSNSKVYDKMRKAAGFMDRWVTWRLAFILSFVCCMLIFFFLYQRVPTELELLVVMFIITSLVYFTINFYGFHLIKYVAKNIDDGIDILSTRCGE